jgi:hypothetical protein
VKVRVGLANPGDRTTGWCVGDPETGAALLWVGSLVLERVTFAIDHKAWAASHTLNIRTPHAWVEGFGCPRVPPGYDLVPVRYEWNDAAFYAEGLEAPLQKAQWARMDNEGRLSVVL